MQEENRPILAADVRLVGKHQLGQHTLVSTDGRRVLVLHDRALVNVERGNEDIFDMALGRIARILRLCPPRLGPCNPGGLV